MVEQLTADQQVIGSNPMVDSEKTIVLFFFVGLCTSAGEGCKLGRGKFCLMSYMHIFMLAGQHHGDAPYYMLHDFTLYYSDTTALQAHLGWPPTKRTAPVTAGGRTLL